MNEGGTVRTSTVFVGVGKETRVFQSLDEVPEEIRRKFENTTGRGNSMSILIADQRGREELARSIQGLPSPVRSRLAELLRAGQPSARALAVRRMWTSWRLWADLAVIGAAGLAVWLAFTWK
jgi:hypothetical protein